MVFLLMTTALGERLFIGLIEKQLERRFGPGVKVGRFETNLLSRIQVGDVNILYPDGAGFLRLGYGGLDYRIWDLVRRDFTLRGISVDTLTIAIRRDSIGQFVFPSSSSGKRPEPDRNSTPLKVNIRKFQLRNAMIEYDDRSLPLEGTVYNFSILCEQEEEDRYHLQVSSDSSRIGYRNRLLPVGHLDAEGDLSPGRGEVRALTVDLPQLALSGQGAIETGQKPSALRGMFSLQGSMDGVSDIFQDALPPTLSPIRGRLEGTLELGGSSDAPRFHGDLHLKNLMLGNLPIPRGHVDVLWQDSLLTLKHLEMDLKDGRVLGDGFVRMDSLLNHRLSLSLEDIVFSEAWNVFSHDSTYTHGLIDGEWISSGPIRILEDIRISSHLRVRRARYHTRRLPDLDVRFSAEMGRTDFFLGQSKNWIEGQMRLLGNQWDGSFRVDISSVEPLAGLLNVSELEGALQGEGKIGGSLSDPQIVFSIRGEALRYQHFPVDSLAASLRYKNGRFLIENGWMEGRLASADTLRPLFHYRGFRGGFAYRTRIAGPLQNPDGEIRAHFFSPDIGGFRFEDGTLQISISDGRVLLDTMGLRTESLIVRVSGEYLIPTTEGRCEISFFPNPQASLHTVKSNARIDSVQVTVIPDVGFVRASFRKELKEGWHLEARGKGFQMENITKLHRDLSEWRGTLGFDLSIAENRGNPSGLLCFEGESFGVGQAVLDSVRGRIELLEHRLTAAPVELYLKGRRSWVEAEFGLIRTQTGGYALTQESEIEGRAEGTDIDLRFLTSLLGLNVEISGISDYRLVWKGRWGRPRIRGHLRVVNGEVRLRPDAIPIQLSEASFALADSVLRIGPVAGRIRDVPFLIEGKVISQGLQTFQAKGRLTVSDTEVIAFGGTWTADSLDLNLGIEDLKLSLCQGIVPNLRQLDGQLNTQINITGATRAPNLFGHLDARNVTLHPQTLYSPLTNGIINIKFDNEQVFLDTLLFRLNGGSIFTRGSTRMTKGNVASLEAKVDVDRVRLNHPKEFNLTVQSIQAGLKMEGEIILLEGDVILGESHLLKDVRPKSLLPFFRKVERPISTPPALLRKTRLDVRIRESDKLWIDNNVAHLRLHTELGLIGILAQPNITGRITVEEGYVLYLDRKFRVEKGVLDFADPHRINPIVEFKSNADIKSYQTLSKQPYTVSLSIQGPLDQAVMDLTSNPPLDRSDILSLLTVGATKDQMIGRDETGKTSLADVLQDRASQLSSRQVSGFTSRRVGNLLGLEEMSIEGNLFNFGKSWGPQLLASKKITDRMEMSYTTRVGHANEQSIRLDYRLSKILSLEGTTDQQGRSGIDLKLRWRFR